MTKPSMRIGVFRALHIGDFLCSIAALRALRRYFSNAHITYIGLLSTSPLIKRFSFYIDDFIPFPGFPGLPEQPFNRKKFILFLQKMRKKQFDCIFQLHGNGIITNSLVSLCGAKTIVGYYKKNHSIPSTGKFFPYPEGK